MSVGRIGIASAARPSDEVEISGLRGDRYFAEKDVLDIGTGNGRLALLIAGRARSVLGVDPDADAIREAKRQARAQGARNARFAVAAAQDLGLARERFDTALFSWSL